MLIMRIWKTQGPTSFSACGVGPLWINVKDMVIEVMIEKTIPEVPKSPGPKIKRGTLFVKFPFFGVENMWKNTWR